MTRKEMLAEILKRENYIKGLINLNAEKLTASPDVLDSLRFQLSDWKELVNPLTRGTRLDAKNDLSDALIVAENITKQIEYHMELLNK